MPLPWGLHGPTLDNETDVQEELKDRRDFFAMSLSNAENAEVKRLLKEMRAAHRRIGKAPGQARRKKSAATARSWRATDIATAATGRERHDVTLDYETHQT